MTTPTYNFKLNNLAETEPLQTLVEQKFAAFAKYWGDHEVLCEVEFAKVAPQQNGQVHRLEVTMTVGGSLYRADAVEENFEKAIDEVRDELDKQLRRAKDKEDTLNKKAGRELKEEMLG
jgi:ribosomal subunit interface protein